MRVASFETQQLSSQLKTIEELMQLTNELSISGMPVVDDGRINGLLLQAEILDMQIIHWIQFPQS